MRFQWLAAIVAALVGGGIAQAQPARDALPTVELRVRCVNDLLDKGQYVGGLIGKEDIVKAVRQILKNLSMEGKGIEGVDPKLPFGLYATLSADVVNSPVVLMVPIADQGRFLEMLKNRLEVVPEKVEDGTLKALVPVVNELFLRFTNGYLYVARSPKDLDPKKLLAPKEFFAREDPAVGSLIVRLDRIPAEVKTFVVGQFELGVAEQRKKNGMAEGPAEKAILDFVGDGLSEGLKSLLDDARELNVRVFINEKGDELSAELTLTAKTGSTMSKFFGSLDGKTSLPAAIVAVRDPAVHYSARIGMPAEMKKRFGGVVDEGVKQILDKADPNAKAIIEKALETLAPTLKAGELDAAASLIGPNAKGQYAIISAAAVKNGKEIEKLLREVSGLAGAVADFDFDVEKIGNFSLHKITVSDAPGDFEKLFGANTFWLAISDDYFAISIEKDGALLKAGLKNKPAAVPVLSIDVAAAKLLPLVARDLKPDEVKAVMTDAFGGAPAAGKDSVKVTITGGDQLTAKVVAKGKAVRLFVAVSELKNK
jgi:hypothetical protein